MVIKSTVGEELTFGKADLKRDHWLFSRRTVTSQDRVASRSIEYSVQEVVVRGSNVVNRAQQRFTPSETGVFKVALLFYPADFAVRDALFGFPIGSTLELTYPDGSTERLALDDRGRAVAPALPRGEYLVSVDGPGLALSAPVALTRPQKADIIFLSFIDIGAAIIGGLAYFAGLPLVGAYVRRRRLPSHLMGTDEPVPPRAANGQFTSASASFYGRRGAAERERRFLEQFASPEIRRGEERERGSQRGSNGHHG
jgi:hypothetical protein